MAQGPLARRETPPHGGQPRQQGHVVFCDGQAADQAQPVQRRGVEHLQRRHRSHPDRADGFGEPAQTDRCRAQRPQPSAPAGAQARHDQHHGNTVQHPKIDKAAGKHRHRASSDEQRRPRHLHPAPPKARPGHTLGQCHRLRQTGGEQKQAHDGGALPGPHRVAVKVLRDPAKVVEVKREVVSRHPQHGQRPQLVDATQAPCPQRWPHHRPHAHVSPRWPARGCAAAARSAPRAR